MASGVSTIVLRNQIKKRGACEKAKAKRTQSVGDEETCIGGRTSGEPRGKLHGQCRGRTVGGICSRIGDRAGLRGRAKSGQRPMGN